MKNIFNTHSLLRRSLLAGLCAVTISFAACKKDDEPTTEKKLVKEKLYDKTWFKQGTTSSTGNYLFNANGNMFGSSAVKWNWVNNSDTLVINNPSPLPKQYLIIEWTTDTEMSLKSASTTTPKSILHKTSMW
jgi:glutamine cyclotransferase